MGWETGVEEGKGRGDRTIYTPFTVGNRHTARSAMSVSSAIAQASLFIPSFAGRDPFSRSTWASRGKTG